MSGILSVRQEDHGMNTEYAADQPPRAQIDELQGAAVVEFGTSWCGYCRAAQPLIAAALVDYPDVQHLKIEDGSGRKLGRSFRIKLWPTLIFLRDGKEVTRLVRPTDSTAISQALAEIDVR
jgi:thioredoxin 1